MKKAICIISSVLASVYTLFYMHYGTAYKNSGALSKIGLTHHTEFVIWGLLTMIALYANIIYAYKQECKTKIHISLLCLSFIGMLLTLAFRFDWDIKPDYYYHCVGSLLFSASTGICIFLLFLINYKNNYLFKIFTYLSASILIIDLIMLLIFKENGLIEVIPIFAGYIMLSITNLRRKKIESTQQA